MSKVKSDTIRAIIYRDCDAWVAQCLEHDICAQADDLAELKARLEITLEAERDYSLKNGKKPFEGIPQAPNHYFSLWDRAPIYGAKPSDQAEKIELALCA